jgi:hypothetical protein
MYIPLLAFRSESNNATSCTAKLLENVHTAERVHEMNVPGKSNPHRHINKRTRSVYVRIATLMQQPRTPYNV